MPLGHIVNFLAKIGVVSTNTATLLDRLNANVNDFIEGDKQGLFTTVWWIVAEKPSKSS
jgi:hypothetical protein